METKSRKKLDDLPKSDDPFFEKADKALHRVQVKKCEHYFTRVTGYSAECKNCHAGYYLGPGYEIKDGHIYNDNKLLI